MLQRMLLLVALFISMVFSSSAVSEEDQQTFHKNCNARVDTILLRKDLPQWFTCIPSQQRSWEGRNGIVITASLMATRNDDIVLKTDQGKEFKTKASFLSEKDQAFIKQFEQEQRDAGNSNVHGYFIPKDMLVKTLDWEADMVLISMAKKKAIEKAVRDVHFEVFQALGDGALCEFLEYDSLLNDYRPTRTIFFLCDCDKRTIAEGDKVQANCLYWAGTYTYETVSEKVRTRNSYSRNLTVAVEKIRLSHDYFVFHHYTEDGLLTRDWFHLNNIHDRPTFITPAQPSPPKKDQPSSEQSDFRLAKGFGSGFFVTKSGYFLTNYHVIREAKRISVLTEDESFEATVVSSDSDNDLALLKVQGDFTPVRFQSTRGVRLGQTVFTVGFPRPEIQGFSPKVTRGVVSGINGMYDDAREFQIDAAIQPGNSGGPIANEKGAIMGMVVATLDSQTRIAKGDQVPQNVNYGIKKSYILAFLESCPSCANQILEGGGEASTIEDAVNQVLKSTALVIKY